VDATAASEHGAMSDRLFPLASVVAWLAPALLLILKASS
jgi:hypothetical protein